MLDMQLKAYKEGTDLLLEDITSRLRQLEQRHSELIHSLQFTQGEVLALQSENKALKEEISVIKKEAIQKSDFEDKFNKLTTRIDYHEDYSRRNNLRVDGLEEQPNETWEVTQDKVQRLLREKLELGPIELERAHRVGVKTNMAAASRPRTVIARFVKFEDRQVALRNSAKLKNTNIYLNEDLCESSMQLRREQLPEMRKARAEGKIAYFSHTRLVIKDRRERLPDVRTKGKDALGPRADGAAAAVTGAGAAGAAVGGAVASGGAAAAVGGTGRATYSVAAGADAKAGAGDSITGADAAVPGGVGDAISAGAGAGDAGIGGSGAGGTTARGVRDSTPTMGRRVQGKVQSEGVSLRSSKKGARS